MSNKVYEIITEQIVEQLEKGIVPWHKPWSSETRMPLNASTNKHYNGINIMLLASQGRYNPYWCTYRQCADLGGNVNRGEKGTMVIFWKISELQDPTDPGKMKKSAILRYYKVFNIEQTSLAEDERFAVPANNHDPIEACEGIVKMYPNKPEIVVGDKAAYRPYDDTVIIPDVRRFEDINEYYSTLFHELVHSTGHESRLARPIKNSFGSEDYSKEELIAEMGNCFLCGIAGIAPAIIDNSAAYIRSWISKLQKDSKLVVMTASKAEKAAKYIQGAA
ncbi:MAG: DUF1738 domain-containing protein [Methanosarcinaceae archaeon]|nr:DUF1738 domain-containing protein [Methanosarcinaceae archaeon]